MSSKIFLSLIILFSVPLYAEDISSKLIEYKLQQNEDNYLEIKTKNNELTIEQNKLISKIEFLEKTRNNQINQVENNYLNIKNKNDALIKHNNKLKNNIEYLKKQYDQQLLKVQDLNRKQMEVYKDIAQNNSALYDRQLTTFNIILTVIGILLALITFYGFREIRNKIDEKVKEQIVEIRNPLIKEAKKMINESYTVSRINIETDPLKQTVKDKKILDAITKDIAGKKDKSPDDWFFLGLEDHKHKEFEKAINAYNKVGDNSINTFEAYFNMGAIYKLKGDTDKAIEMYNKAMDIRSDDANLYNNIGAIYAQKGDTDKAIKMYNKAMDIRPNDANLYNNIGAIYAQKGDTDKAIEMYNKAMDIRPNDATFYNNMGNAYAQKGVYDKALKYYTKSLDIRPNVVAGVYTNLFELAVIGDIPLNESIEKDYIEKFGKDKESFMRYEMINIIKAIKNNEEYDFALKKWKKTYADTSGSWDFREFDTWIEKITDLEIQKTLRDVVENFKHYYKKI